MIKSILLTKEHDRVSFSCNNRMIDTYLKKQVSQDVKRNLTTCYVFAKGSDIIGYYTISTHSIDASILPDNIKKQLPKSYDIPAVLLGRLGVDVKYSRKGYGEGLVVDALKRSLILSQQIGIKALVVDPLNKIAESMYKKLGFIYLNGANRMFYIL